MREIGIQFSAPMVRAILDGSKTVTRRTVKGPTPRQFGEIPADHRPELARVLKMSWAWVDHRGHATGKTFRCPYGQPGDRLWVREAWRTTSVWDGDAPKNIVPGVSPISYEADGADARLTGKFRPGMFMPRWASRIDLEVTDVKCERLQAITTAEAVAEGIDRDTRQLSDGDWRDYLDTGHAWADPVRSYRSLWELLNGEDGPDSWRANPWVFAISFRRITP